MTLWIILLWIETAVLQCLWLHAFVTAVVLQTLSTLTDKDQLITRPCFQERKETGKTVALTDLNMHLIAFVQSATLSFASTSHCLHKTFICYIFPCNRISQVLQEGVKFIFVFSIHWGHMMSPTCETVDLLPAPETSKWLSGGEQVQYFLFVQDDTFFTFCLTNDPLLNFPLPLPV